MNNRYYNNKFNRFLLIPFIPTSTLTCAVHPRYQLSIIDHRARRDYVTNKHLISIKLANTTSDITLLFLYTCMLGIHTYNNYFNNIRCFRHFCILELEFRSQ